MHWLPGAEHLGPRVVLGGQHRAAVVEEGRELFERDQSGEGLVGPEHDTMGVQRGDAFVQRVDDMAESEAAKHAGPRRVRGVRTFPREPKAVHAHAD